MTFRFLLLALLQKKIIIAFLIANNELQRILKGLQNLEWRAEVRTISRYCILQYYGVVAVCKNNNTTYNGMLYLVVGF